METELRRVGCLSEEADGNWNTTSQRSLTLFNRYAKTRLDTKVASIDALDTIKQKSARVCPLVCAHGYEADGNSCTKITCAAGSFLNDDNECEKRRDKKPVATRDRPESQAPEARQAPQAGKPWHRSRFTSGVVLKHRLRGSAKGQPLTGQERAVGCNSYGAIMSAYARNHSAFTSPRWRGELD